MMTATRTNEAGKIHPQKFTLWVAIGSLCMMFAGLTSAYIVRRNQANWLEFEFPITFWYSTFVILLSSLTMHLSVKYFKARERNKYKNLISITTLLGILFVSLQFIAFQSLNHSGIQLIGQGSNPSASFLVVIIGLHMLHLLGGIVALSVIFLKSFSTKTKSYNSIPLEIVATYWHFVDILWIYLFIFLLWIK
jgi:cytochrome c oxidase subunit 3